MKDSLRLTLQIMAGIFAIFFTVPVFLPSGYTITATTEIKAPPKIVFNEVNVLRNWKIWSQFEQDSTMVNHYEGPAAGVKAKRTWTSQHTGNGSIEITRSVPYRFIETKTDFGAPGKATGRWIFSNTNGNTQVSWELHISGLQYPFGKWLGIILKKSMKPVLEKGLEALKTTVEEKSGSKQDKNVTE